MSPPKNKKESDDMYQLGEAVRRLEDQNKEQSQCLDRISDTLNRVCELLEKFSNINERQTRLEAVVEVLQEDNKGFKAFMRKTYCKTHETEISHLKKDISRTVRADEKQNSNAFTLLIAFFTALFTGIITWFVTTIVK